MPNFAYIDLLQYTLDGTLTGVLYAIIAIAFIVVYRAGRTLNFAQGEVIIFMAYIIWTLIFLAHLPAAVVIPLSLVALLIANGIVKLGETAREQAVTVLDKKSQEEIKVRAINVAEEVADEK